ncbi:hypothetical protein PGT21_027267 [Puccinia graminis f. sp. tritici]|uniref:Uncharacterized protein n=1 Tax=Puccinia graminis f. sp. tritici TaxID=56615 RepID=A0A5B0S0F9_PUCGR|nr:hypothetical protein PGT21_027267 [Puccinia graminis f. sp. tritici]KAA1130969.1 hypothetical protein PGTUg99_017965 [Puccinia graminis f. sp. tritici]
MDTDIEIRAAYQFPHLGPDVVRGPAEESTGNYSGFIHPSLRWETNGQSQVVNGLS